MSRKKPKPPGGTTPPPRKAQGKTAAAQRPAHNPRLAQQIRRILGKHYANRYGKR